MAIEIRHAGGVWSGQTDGLGRFAVADLPLGPMRVLVRPGHDGQTDAVVTAIFVARP